MVESSEGDRLSRISTAWTRLFDALDGKAEAARSAQAAVIDQYSAAAYRYLLKILGSPDAAEDVLQQFALEFVKGGFRHATPQRGRFRDYLKVSLARLAYRHRKTRARERFRELGDDAAERGEERSVDELEQEFVASCRDEMLNRAWRRLRNSGGESGETLFAVLRYRSEHPASTSEQMAEAVSRLQHRDPPLTPAAARKLLQRARERFADHVLTEVASTIPEVSRETLEEEVISLGLHPYCKSALRRRFRSGGEEK